jgi:hypothetical protein
MSIKRNYLMCYLYDFLKRITYMMRRIALSRICTSVRPIRGLSVLYMRNGYTSRQESNRRQ